MDEGNLVLPEGLMIVEKYGVPSERHWCYDYRPKDQGVPVRRIEVHALEDHYLVVDDWFFGKIALLGITHTPEDADERAYELMRSFAMDRTFKGLNAWEDHSGNPKPHDSRPVSRLVNLTEQTSFGLTLENKNRSQSQPSAETPLGIHQKIRLTLYDEDISITRVYSQRPWFHEGDEFILDRDIALSATQVIRAGIYCIGEENKPLLRVSTSEDTLEQELIARRVMGLDSM